jgi:peptidoglycan/xylan/chitin deacetylase (PgdA/CDA1 family)
VRGPALLALVLAVALAGCGGSGGGPARGAQPPQRSGARPRPPAPAPPRHVAGRHDAPVPVLVYHVIGTYAGGSSLEGLYVPPAELRAQVAWLARAGWHAVTLDRVLAYWRDGVALPRKPVVLTFDDGYPGDWRYALPILRAHGWPGVLNLQIGNLVPLHVRQLIDAGWEIASHTFTHPDLTTVGQVQLTREVAASRAWLQRVYRVPVRVFCYPYGHYDAAVVAAVRRAGYAAAETENPGWASPADGLLTLDRIRVGPTTGVAGLAALLRAPSRG